MTDLCVDLGGTNVKLAIAERGRLGAATEFPVRGDAGDLDAIVEAARTLASDISTVAIAVPGLVDAAGRRLVEAHGKYEWLLGADLAAWAGEAFGASARLENDARAALLGETATGCAPGERDAIILVLGTGIGTAAMIDGVALRGPHGSAGILAGHITIDWNGPDCNCGNVGCPEVYGAGWSLPARIRDARAAHPELESALDPDAGFAGLTAAVRAGDPLAARVFDDAVRAWAVTAVSLAHAFDPRAVILAGGIARSADLVAPAIEAHLDRHLWSSVPRPAVLVSAQPELSVLRGLAVLAQETSR